MPSKKTWMLIAAVIIAIIVVASLAVAFWVKPSTQEGTVRVGWLTGDLHGVSYFVAKNATAGGGTSFFEKYNVNVTDAKAGGYANGGYVMDAFARGEVDIGYFGSPPAITKNLNADVNTTIIAQVNEIGSALVTKQQITTLSDLIGKTIATPGQSTIQYFLFLRLAEEEGIGIGNFTLTVLPVGNMKASLEGGSIDAFIAWEPYCANTVVNNAGYVYKNSSDIWPDHICCVIVASKTFAAEHPDIVVNFLKAHIDATNWINEAQASGSGSTNYDLLVGISGYTGFNEAVIKHALTNVIYKYDIDVAFMGNFIDFTYKLLQYGIALPGSTIQAKGYNNVYDYAYSYVNTTYLTLAKQN